MSDLRIFESVISALLAIYILRPFVRNFRGVDGLSALPMVSFLLIAAAIPAFGFRPELVPLSLFAFFALLSSLPRMVDIARRLRTDDYGESKPLAAVLGMVFLCFSFAFAFLFPPSERGDLRPLPAGSSFAAEDGRRGVRLVLTVEGARPGAFAEPAPALIFGPAVLGSAGIFDDFRAGLVSRGFTVVTYVRPGFDVPAVDETGRLVFPGMSSLADSLAALLFGDELAFAAEAGARLEKERLDDLRFAVAYVRSRSLAGDVHFGNIDMARISVVGYGAGGAAAAMYAAEADPAEVRSVTVIEAPIHSYFTIRTDTEELSPSGITRYLGLAKRALRFRTVRSSIQGDSAAVIPRVPALFLTSDWISEVPLRDNRYGTLVRLFRLSGETSAMAFVAGAGPLDYTDIPIDYPVYAFFSRGKDRFIPFGTPFSSRAAELVSSFAEDFSAGLKPAPGVHIEKK